jgi:branched-chain amino acid transport system substrate-binding protein
VQKAEKLIQVSKVNLLTGTVNSASTLAVGQLAERNNVLASTTVSYSDAITGEKCSPNLFRVNARAEQQSITLAAYVARQKPKARVFYIGPDYEMGRSSVSAFKLYAEKAGLQSVGEFFAPLDSKDYSQYFGPLRAARPDVIYTAVAGNDTVRLLTQMQEFGLLKNVLVTGNAGVINSQNLGAIGSAAEGFISGNNYSPKIDTPENKRFVAAYKAAYKTDPDGFAADSYGLVYLYKLAIEKAGSTDTDKVRAALKNLSWQTPQGTKTLRGGDHQAVQDMVVVAVRKGEFDVVGKVPGAESIGPDTCTRF